MDLTFFDTLLSKTLLILSIQLFITFLSTKWLINYFRKQYLSGHSLVTATKNEKGEIDLDIPFQSVKKPFYALLIVDFIVFLVLLFWGEAHPQYGFFIFCFWSVLTGFELALSLLAVDENLGVKVLRLTATLTFGAAVIGLYSGIDFSFLSTYLFLALLGLVGYQLVNIFRSFSEKTQLFASLFGAILFVLYLVFDFNRIDRLKGIATENNWSRALDFSIKIYLDIVNLFLQLLSLMGKSHH